MIMHLGTQTTRKSKRYFAKGIQKAMANQVAYDKIQQIRDKEKLKESQKEEAQANEPQG